MTDSSPAKRRHLRIPQPVQLMVREGPPRFLGYMSDISETGLFVQCTNPRQAGDQLEVQLRLPGEQDAVAIRLAEVIWSRGYTGRRGPCPGMGLRFVAISHAARAALERFLITPEPAPAGAAEIADACP